MSVVGDRLKQARLEAGLSQERLGVLAGIDEMSASARMNQYERGVHTPGYPMVEQFAKALDMPVEYFYAKEDKTADLLLLLHSMSDTDRERVKEFASTIRSPI